MINNRRLIRAFINHYYLITFRHQEDPDIFAKRDWKCKSHSEERHKIIQKYTEYANRFSWNLQDRLPIIVCAHGTSLATAQKICKTGFVTLSTLDSGFYGQGMYFTTHIPYIFPYVVSLSKPVMIMTLVIPGNVYPVVEDRGCDESLMGKSIKSGYQSHFVLTQRSGTIFHLPEDEQTSSNEKIYDELVLNQESQVLPIFLIELDPLNFNTLTAHWQREISIQEPVHVETEIWIPPQIITD